MRQIIQAGNLERPELQIYACRSEVQLLRYYEPEPGIFIAESPNVISRALQAGYEPLSVLADLDKAKEAEWKLIRKLEEQQDIPVYLAEEAVLKQLTGFELTRGMFCAMRRKAAVPAEEICAGVSRLVVLENIVNPTNTGAIFRSAAALSMDAVLLTEACCDPFYRRSARVSMGTVFQIPWTYVEQSVWEERGIALLKEMGFTTVAMALREDSLSLEDKRLKEPEKLAIIFGTEGEGLTDRTIAACDYTVRIPMSHQVDSLNVAAASAVTFWELSKTV